VRKLACYFTLRFTSMNLKSSSRRALTWGSGAYSTNFALKCLLSCAVVGWIYIVGFVHQPSSAAVGVGDGAALLRGTVVGSQTAQAHSEGVLSRATDAGGVEHKGGVSGHFSHLVQNDFDAKHLIVVAGHAVVRMNQLMTADVDDSAWWLLKYQKQQGFPAILSSHIKRGISLLAADPQALLLFSGGQTRRDVGPISEAASYYYLADAKGWVPTLSPTGAVTASTASVQAHREPRERIFLEEYARDSLENLLFSVCRYREVVGSYPQRVTVVGFDFKAERFKRLHAAALGLSGSAFAYEGLSSGDAFRQKEAEQGEQAVVRAFTADPYACSHELHDKEELRNPFRRSIPYLEACPEIKDLLLWCGPAPYPGLEQLPWAQTG
jgi:hypothetical protein